MSRWNGITAVSFDQAKNLFANSFNDVYNAKCIDVVRVRNGVLYAIIGKPLIGEKANGMPPAFRFDRMDSVSGYAKELRFLGTYGNVMSPVVNGSAELATVDISATYDDSLMGSVLVQLTHFPYKHGVPESEIRKCAGNEAKTASLVAEYAQFMIGKWEHTLGTALGGVTAQSNSAMGGWQWPVSDGVSSGETGYALYYGIDRSDADNANFRATVNVNPGDLTTPVLDKGISTCRLNGGYPDLAPCNLDVYIKVKGLIEQFTVVNYDSQWSKFGGDWCQLGGTKFLLDAYTPSGVLGLLDTSTFVFSMNEQGFETGFSKAEWTAAGYMLAVNSWCGLTCNNPKANYKFTNIPLT